MTTHDKDTAGVPDPAFEALVAADPAHGAEADLARLRATVAAKIADGSAYPSHGRGVPDAVTYEVEDLADARRLGARVPDDRSEDRAERATPLAAAGTLRPARRGRALQVAAVAAGVLVVGGGGFASGLVAAGSDTPGTPIHAMGQADARAEGMIGSGDGAADSMASEGSGMYTDRTIFTGSGLSDQPGAGTVWGFDVAAVYSAETVEQAARALGLDGPARQEEGTWMVGDWSGPTVTLSADGLGYLSYYDDTLSPYVCTDTVVSSSAATAPALEDQLQVQEESDDSGEADELGESGAASEPAYYSECVLSDVLVAPEDAIERVRGMLGEMGVDVTALIFTAEAYTEQGDMTQAPSADVYVQATSGDVSAVDYLGTEWSASVSGEGVYSLNGALAPRVDLGQYPTISPAEAVARLNDPRFGFQDQHWPDSYWERAWTPRATAPATPQAGDPIAWPVEEVTITSATETLLTAPTRTDGVLLLPAYRLGSADGRSWTVLALTEDALETSVG
ncbi:MAG: hypothetical protein ACTMIR_05385 [Cellulomonadaceae bacterium]